MPIDYEIRERVFPHHSGDLTLFQIVSIYPGGRTHVSSDGDDDFKTLADAEAEVQRRRQRQRG